MNLVSSLIRSSISWMPSSAFSLKPGHLMSLSSFRRVTRSPLQKSCSFCQSSLLPSASSSPSLASWNSSSPSSAGLFVDDALTSFSRSAILLFFCGDRPLVCPDLFWCQLLLLLLLLSAVLLMLGQRSCCPPPGLLHFLSPSLFRIGSS